MMRKFPDGNVNEALYFENLYAAMDLLIDLHNKGCEYFYVLNLTECSELEMDVVYLFHIWKWGGDVCKAEIDMRNTYHISRHHMEEIFFTYLVPIMLDHYGMNMQPNEMKRALDDEGGSIEVSSPKKIHIGI